MEKMIAAVKRFVMGVISDEALYLFFAFLFGTALNSSLFLWYREPINLLTSYVLIPWSIALCVLRLNRAQPRELMQRDTGLLTLMFLWVTVPFYLRFGVTFNNVTNWYGQAVVFFAVYAMTREEEKARRDAMLDRLCALFAALSFAYAGVLLTCAATGQFYELSAGVERVGVTGGGNLQSGVHYNITGMESVCMLMMCMVGVSRRRHMLTKLLHLIPGVMMLLVVVLTQSRTARYSVLLAFAVGTYGALCTRLALPKKALCHAAAVIAAAAVLVGGYVGAGMVTDAALKHYSGEKPVFQLAAAEEAAGAGAAARTMEAREAVDATFSDRTNIWKNLFELWKENPKYLVIGNGIGRTGSRIVKGTIHEQAGAVAVHNTYLQLLADFGIVGAAILLAFFLTVASPALRVFFAKGERRFAGGHALCMLVIAILATGMMESQPLGANTPMNMMLYYALAILCAEGRQLQKA